MPFSATLLDVVPKTTHHYRTMSTHFLAFLLVSPMVNDMKIPMSADEATRQLAEETAARVGAIEDELRRVALGLGLIGIIVVVRWLLERA